MSVQPSSVPSAYGSTCPIIITKTDNILTYQTAYGVVGPRNNGGSSVNCFPTDYKLSYVYGTDQLNLCCNNILSKKTAV